MRKILLVIDEFNEMVGLETLFRRLGFDVLSITKESVAQETILGYPPDLIIATGRGRHVDGLTLGSRLRFSSARPRIMVLLPREAMTGGFRGDLIDAIVPTPFEPRSTLKAVCRLLQLPVDPLLEKYAKIMGAKLAESEEIQFIKNEHGQLVPALGESVRGAASQVSSIPLVKLSPREERYKKFLETAASEELPPMADGQVMRDARIKLQKAASQDGQQLDEILKEKREFVRAMVRLASSLKK